MRTPYLVGAAEPIPGWQSQGTRTFTKARGEGSDQDAIDDLDSDVQEVFDWRQVGAWYDETTGIWMMGKVPLVLHPGLSLGTRTMTEIAREPLDEDP